MIWDILASGLLIFGGVMAVIGSLGLLRLRGAMQRLHAPSVSNGLGIAAVALALALAGANGWPLLMSLILIVTAPLTAFYLAQTHRR